MSNKHPTPPPPRINRADHPHFEAAGMTLVEQYNLTNIVREKRMQGMSYRELTDYINNTPGLIPNNYKISHNSIARYCRDHGLGGDVSEESTDEAVNVYRENCKSLHDINTALDIISVQLDEMSKQVGKGSVNVKDLSTMINSLDKLTLRRQTLTASIGEMQEKVYTYETVSRIVGTMMAMVSVWITPDHYEKLKDMLRKDPILCEALREIAPSNI